MKEKMSSMVNGSEHISHSARQDYNFAKSSQFDTLVELSIKCSTFSHG
jgi:hypothetical protein